MLGKRRNNSGIILATVLWIVVILTILAVTLGRRTRVDVALTRNAVGKIKAKYIATAGLVYALDKIKQDSANPDTQGVDTLFKRGVALKEDQTAEEFFKDVAVGEGSFSIFFKEHKQGEPPVIHYGFQDEESKIDLNGLTPNNYKIMVHLITQFGHDEKIAETIASAIVDWIDAGDEVFNDPYGAEKDYYFGLEPAYACKNFPFDSIEEVRLVRAMTPEIFKDIKDYITIFPKEGRWLVNLDTASDVVLRAMARSLSGAASNTTVEDADALANKILDYRKGDDRMDGTEDDRLADVNEINLNAKEKILYLLMAQQQTKVSNYLRIFVKGRLDDGLAQSSLEAVISRSDLAVVYWRREN